jgi:hypothetical protein
MNNKKNNRIWIWMQENNLHKAVYTPNQQTLVVYNERDEIVLKRNGITTAQFTNLEAMFVSIGARRIDGRKEPFTYL